MGLGMAPGLQSSQGTGPCEWGLALVSVIASFARAAREVLGIRRSGWSSRWGACVFLQCVPLDSHPEIFRPLDDPGL